MCRMAWYLIWSTSSFYISKKNKVKRGGKSAILPNWWCRHSIPVHMKFESYWQEIDRIIVHTLDKIDSPHCTSEVWWSSYSKLYYGAKSVTLIFGQTPSKKQIDHLSRLLSITTMPNMAPHTGDPNPLWRGFTFIFMPLRYNLK